MTITTEPDFAVLIERHRREIHVHCYRMLGSFEAAEDLVQETFLRAWDRRDSFSGERNLRAWLYRIATNACIDAIRRDRRQAPARSNSYADLPWLTPYPDLLLDEVAPREDEPDAVLVARETIELAYLALIQLLPARQRAVLLLRDVLEWSAAETADALGMTIPAVTSALQRARATLASRSSRERRAGATSDYEQRLLAAFIDAHERGDLAASLAIAREDIRVTMPPLPMCFEGRAALAPLIEDASSMGEWRVLATAANRMPAAACYLRRPGDTEFRAMKLDVLAIEGELIAEITTFGSQAFAAFGLAETLA